MPNVYLLTGSPGVGKTTVIREAIAGSKSRAGGFYTEEIRVGGVRQGFKIITLDGHDSILAHANISSHHRVGKYAVDVDNLNDVAVTSIHQAINETDLIVIDEIGRMELFSSLFREAVLKAISSNKKVLGSIMLNHHPFADEIKRLPGVKVVQVSRVNRNQILNEVMGWLKSTTDENNAQADR